MTFKFEFKEVSPEYAQELLNLSLGNRKLSEDYILSLAVAMETGKWVSEASEIVLDEDNALIDGHHRLNAIIAYGKPVTLAIKRGVPAQARGVIDTGRGRNIADLIKMFRPGETHTTRRKAALQMCISLLIPGRKVQVKTLDAYDVWYRQFKDGINAVVENGGHEAMFKQSVSGPFAFAYKTNPTRVLDFMIRVRDGAGLRIGEPAHTIRSLIFNPNRTVKGQDRYVFARKVLQAIHAELRNKPYAKAQDGLDGLEFFRVQYDTRTINQMVNSWAPESPVLPVTADTEKKS
jgi:hypothetical protein